MRKLSLLVITVLVLTFGGTSAQATLPRPVMPSWARSASIYEVNVRQFAPAAQGKKFAAVQARLPRLKKLGVQILWLMPIYQISVKGRLGSLGSPYAVANYKAVNPEFGSLTSLKSLVKEAHKQGLHVILDWVGNHTGLDNVWTASHPEWYTVVNGQVQPNADWRDVADLNYDNAQMRAAMLDAMKYWVTEVGIDGYRCDFAGGVPTSFWNEANAALQKIKPLFMLSENDSDYSHLESAFVANYGWQTLGVFNNFATRGGDSSAFEATFSHLRNDYPTGTFPMTFITNHDENSWNGTEFERLGSYVKRFAALQFTLPGMPLIYNGQEIGLNRRLAFFESDPITWKSSSYTDFYRKLIALKTSNAALWNGASGGVAKQYLGSNDNVLTYTRVKGSNKVIVVINLSDTAQLDTVSLGSNAGSYFAYSNGRKVKLASKHRFSLAANSFEIYSTKLVK